MPHRIRLPHSCRPFTRESSGKCYHCHEGTAWMEQILLRVLYRPARPEDIDLLLDICDNIRPSIAWPSK